MRREGFGGGRSRKESQETSEERERHVNELVVNMAQKTKDYDPEYLRGKHLGLGVYRRLQRRELFIWVPFN
jgi:hypothetical protein